MIYYLYRVYYKNINNKNYSELIEHKVLFFSPSEIIGGIGSYLGSNATSC